MKMWRCSRVGLISLVIVVVGLLSGVSRAVTADFDGDGRTDIGCYDPSLGNWYLLQSTAGLQTEQFGYSGTIPVVADFDGDGLADIGCYYPPAGNWYLLQSTEGLLINQFGFAGTVPVVGDFDGDGFADIGCYYPPSGNWYLLQSSDGFVNYQFGFDGTIPVVGDYDGDGQTDIGCYYPPAGNWYLQQSTEGLRTHQFGFGGTIPIVGDYDGDGLADIGCYFPPAGNWYLLRSTEGLLINQFGFAGTAPVVGDFDGDGLDDIGCYYPPTGDWYLSQSTDGFITHQFGYTGTAPIVGPSVATVELSAKSVAGGNVYGAGVYGMGTLVTIQAVANKGYKFVSWSDGNMSATRVMQTPAEGINLTASFAADVVPLTWEPGQSIGGVYLGDSYTLIKVKLGNPSRTRRSGDPGNYTMWSDYDHLGLHISYLDSNGDGQLNNEETADGLQTSLYPTMQPWTYQGLTFGSSAAQALSVMGPASNIYLDGYWWFSQGTFLDIPPDQGIRHIYIYYPF
ncbi:MAG: VCBS repeat-containing protein [Spartobacteria bacterium]|nr:VCBS repeat-containing protein [Spartobacteria bacterium]